MNTLSFSNFYTDQNLKGHFLLRPSIFVACNTKRIFSKIEGNGALNHLSEITKRVFLAFVIVLVSIPSALIIPLGLLLKQIDLFYVVQAAKQASQSNSYSSTKEDSTYSLAVPDSKTAQKKNRPKPIVNYPPRPSTAPIQPHPSAPLNPPSSTFHYAPTQRKMNRSNDLRKVEKAINRIDESLSKGELDRVELRINNIELEPFRRTARLTFDDEKMLFKTDDRELNHEGRLYKRLLLLEEEFHTRKKVSEDAKIYEIQMSPEGEVHIPKTDDGNCLFRSFPVACKLANIPLNETDKTVLRQQAIKWKERHTHDPKLKIYLYNSLYSLFDDDLQKLQQELAALDNVLSLPDLDKDEQAKVLKRKEEIPLEIEKANTLFSKIKNQTLNVEEEKEVFSKYLQYNAQEDTYSSFAEIYALANCYQLTIELFKMVKVSESFKIIKADEDFVPQGVSRGTIRLLHVNGNHYIPYVPKSD